MKILKFLITSQLFLFSLSVSKVYGQVGTTSFNFLNLPITARQVALGGMNISTTANDVNMFMANPALLTDSVSNSVSFNHYSYNAGVKSNAVSYARKFKSNSMLAINIWQLGYGDFEGYDITGTYQGTFSANDFALTLAYSQKLGLFTLGSNLKFIQSNIENYTSNGLLFDFGGTFTHPKKELKIGLVFKNFGFLLKEFTPGQTYEMPFDVQLGVTFKPKKMPFRFSLTAHHLQKFDIAYDDPNEKGKTDAFGNEITNEISFADKLARHFVIGGEFVLSRNLNLRFGYNFLQRKELAIDGQKGAVGFSYGLMLRIKKIEFAYARAAQQLDGGTNNITLSFNTRTILKKKKIIE